jgi:hypothetical protein
VAKLQDRDIDPWRLIVISERRRAARSQIAGLLREVRTEEFIDHGNVP